MKIEIYRNDWIFNAGITGFLRILEKADKIKEVQISYDCISFDLNILRGFESNFFDYARTRVFSIDRRLEYCNIIYASLKELDNDKFLEIKPKAYKLFSGYRNLMRNNPTLVEAVSSSTDAETLIKATKDIELYLTENQKKFATEDARMFLMMDFFSGISCFNSTFKGDTIKKFKETFMDPIFHEVESSKKKYACTNCSRETNEKIFLDAGILKPFSVSRFKGKNFSWNNIPDSYLCPICRLIYLCVFAGLNPYHKRNEYGHFMFTDSDLSIQDNLKNNDTFLNLVVGDKQNFNSGNFRDISVDLNIKKGKELDSGFFFADISVDKSKSLKIDFKTPDNIENLFCKKNDSLFNDIRNFIYKDGSIERYVLEETVDALMNNVCLENLIAKLLKDSLNNKNNRQKDLYSLIKLENIRRTLEIEKRESDKKIIKALFLQGEIFGERIMDRNYSIMSIKSYIFKMLFPLISNNNAAAKKQLSIFYANFNHKQLSVEEKTILNSRDNLFILAYLNGIIASVNKKKSDESELEEKENVEEYSL